MNFTPLAELFGREHSDSYPVALSEEGVLDFAQLKADVAYNAAEIIARQIQHAALFCDNSYWFVVGFYALLYAKAEIVIPPNVQPGTLLKFSNIFKYCVSDRRTIGNEVLLGSATKDIRALAPLDPHSSKLTFFTSGSSGEPKYISKTLHQLDAEVHALEKFWGPQIANAAIYATVTHQHIFGLTFKLLWPLAAGRPFAVPHYIIWEQLIVELHEPAVIITSPAQLSRIEGLRPLEQSKCPILIFVAGAPLSYASACKAKDIFGRIPQELYGSTETGLIAQRQQTGRETAWQPLPEVTVRAGADSLLEVQSPFIGGNGLYKLEDRIQLHETGFSLLGRADRIVKIAGKRISLPEIESNLLTLPWFQAGVVSTIGEVHERLGAVVVLNDEGRRELDRLGRFRFSRAVTKRLALVQEPVAIPRIWRFVDMLPIDSMGKVKRNDIEILLRR